MICEKLASFFQGVIISAATTMPLEPSIITALNQELDKAAPDLDEVTRRMEETRPQRALAFLEARSLTPVIRLWRALAINVVVSYVSGTGACRCVSGKLDGTDCHVT